MSELTGAEFKAELRSGSPKMGLFINSHSPTVAEQFAHSGYDWLLIDMQHGPMNPETLSSMVGAVGSGGAKSLVRVGGYSDRAGDERAVVVVDGSSLTGHEMEIYFNSPDINGDLHADCNDAELLVGDFGTGEFRSDLNDDGIVDGADLANLLANWGICFPV